jgi:aflatoxin B1 aldehyde reductase
MSSEGIKIIFGGGGLRPERGFPDHHEVKKALDILEEEGIDTIDTARLYGPSETLLGQAGAGDRFILDTKVAGGFIKGSLSKDGIKKSVEKSLGELRIKKVGTTQDCQSSPRR